MRAALLGRLLLERPERPELTLRLDDPLHLGRAEGPDELGLEIGHADVEAEGLHRRPVEAGADAGALQGATEVVLLVGVAQPRQIDVQPVRAVVLEVPTHVLGPTHGHDPDAVGGEIPSPPLGQRGECEAVAHPLDQHDAAKPRRPVRGRLVRVG